MARCPNCNALIEWDTPNCPSCNALFGGDPSAWQPVGETEEEIRKLADQKKERRLAHEKQPDADAVRLAGLLTHAAVIGWIASLFLPGFVVESRIEPWIGGPILLFGLIFGWAVGGFAVYANLLFPYIAIRLYMGKGSPVASTAMMCLAVTIFFFQGVVRDEGSGAILPVVSWGWGAALWIASLITATIASGLHSCFWEYRRATKFVLGIFIALAGIGALHFTQTHSANEQEKEIYLSKGMAFTTKSFCGIPLSWPDHPITTPEDMVYMDIDDDFKSPNSKLPYLWLPQLENVQEGAFQWRTFRDPVITSGQVKVRSKTSDARYVIRVQKTDQGAAIRLIDNKTSTTLHEQPLRIRPLHHGSEICPYPTRHWPGLTKGYDTAIMRAVGQIHSADQVIEKIEPQTARQPCSLGDKDVDGIRGLRKWDGRDVILEPESVRTRIGFCSERYIGLVYIFARSTDPTDLSPVVEIFERKSMKPIAVFNDGRPCPLAPRARCEEAPKSILKGIRIDEKLVIVETERGELQANRIYR